MAAKKCLICNQPFAGRRDAKTCSPRCRKRLQLIRGQLQGAIIGAAAGPAVAKVAAAEVPPPPALSEPPKAPVKDKRRLGGPWLALLVLGIASLLGIFLNVSGPKAQAATANSDLNFQARLLNSAGAVVPDGDYNIEFKIYNVDSTTGSQGSCNGTSCLWMATYTGANAIPVTNGYFSVSLGTINTYGSLSSINWDQQMYLTMRIGGIGTPSWDGEMQNGGHSIPITATPYSFAAGQLAATSGSNRGTLSFGSLTNNPVIALPDASGTVCLQGDTADCGFAAASGANYIAKNAADASSANVTGNLLGLTNTSTGAAGVLGLTNNGTNSALSITQSGTAEPSTGQALLLVNNNTTTPSGNLIDLQSKGVSQLSVDTGGNLTSAGTFDFTGAGDSYLGGSLGLGVVNPQGALSLLNGDWITAVDSSGSGFVNLFSLNSNNQIQAGAAIAVDGGIVLPTDAGQVTLSDLPVDSSISTGTPESYTLRVGSTNALTIYGEGDGSGGIKNVRVAVGSSIAPAYTLDVGGDVNVSTGSVYRVAGTPGSSIPCSGGDVLSNPTVSGGIITGGTCVANGGGTTPTLQQTYDASSSPQITLDGSPGAGGLVIRDNATTSVGTAFQVQNASGVSELSVDTSDDNVSIGSANTLTGSLVFYNATSSSGVTLQAAGGTSAYTLDLPVVAPTAGQCLQAGSSVAEQLAFGSCGGSLQAAYDDSDTPATITTTSSSKGVVIKAGGAGATTPTLVRQVTNSGTGVSSLSTSITATGSGHLLVANIALSAASSRSVSSVIDSAGNTWNCLSAGYYTGVNSYSQICYAENANSVTSVTVNVSGGTTNVALNLSEFSGVALSSALDTSNSQGNASSTSAPTPTITTTGSDDLIIGGLSFSGAATVTSPGGVWVNLANNSAGTQNEYEIYQVASSTGNYGATWTLSSGTASGTSIAAFKAAGAASDADSTNLFQIQNSSGSSLLNADSSNMRVSVGSIGTATGQLYVSGSTPVDLTGGGVAASTYTNAVYVQGKYAYVGTNSKFMIFDVSNPASPFDVTAGSLTKTVTSVYVQGDYAYTISNASNTFNVIDVSDPSSPSVVGSVSTQSGPKKVYVQGRYAYVIDNTVAMLQVFDVSNPSDPVAVGSISTSSGPHDLFVQGHYAYVVDNTSGKFQVFDVSNPASPVEVTTPGGISVATAYDVYVSGRYAYITDGASKFYTYDVSNPASPALTGTDSSCGSWCQAIYMQGRYAYVIDASSDLLRVIDVSSPSAPVNVASGATATNPNGIFVAGRYAYVTDDDSSGLFQIFDLGGTYTQQLEAGGTETGTLQVDTNAQVAGDINIQGGGAIGQSLAVDGNVSVGGQLNVSGKLPSSVLSSASIGGCSVTGVAISGRYAFAAVPGCGDIHVYDISDPASITQIGSSLVTDSNNRTPFVSGHYLYWVNYGSSTLQIADISNTGSLSIVSDVATQDSPVAVWVQGRYAYVLSGDGGSGGYIQAFDISNPSSPVALTATATGVNFASGFYVQGNWAYVTGTASSLYTFNLSNPGEITAAGNVALGGSTFCDSNDYWSHESVYVQGEYAYVTVCSTDTLKIINVSNPASPAAVTGGSITESGWGPIGVQVQGHYAYVTDFDAGNLAIFDVSNAAAPALVNTLSVGTQPVSTDVQGRYAYVSLWGGTDNFESVDLGGAYIQQLEAGGTETGTLQVDSNAQVAGDINIQGGGAIGQSLSVQGDLSVSGANISLGYGPAGSAVGSFPSTPVLDDFNRADGSPGANWAEVTTPAPLPNISGDEISATSESSGYWVPMGQTVQNGEVYADVTGEVYLYIRTTGVGQTHSIGYLAHYKPSTSTISIEYWNNGTLETTVCSASSPAGMTSLGMRADGSTLTAYAVGSSGTWAQICQGTDSSITGPGVIGFETAGSSSTVDNFGGGPLPSSVGTRQTINIGATTSDSSVTIQSGTGNINLNSSDSTIVKSVSDSLGAFQVQDSGGSDIFNVDTQNDAVTINGNSPEGFEVYSPANSEQVLTVNTSTTDTVSIGDTMPASDAKLYVMTSDYVGLRVNETGSSNLLQLQDSGVNVVTVSNSGVLALGSASGNNGSFVLYNAGNGNTLTFVSGATAASTTIYFPSTSPATSVQQGNSYIPLITDLTADTAASSSTTLAAIQASGNANDSLSFTVPAGKTVSFTIHIIYVSTSTNNTAIVGWKCSNASQTSLASGYVFGATSGGGSGTTTACTTSAANIVAGPTSAGSTTPAQAIITGTIEANSSAATIVTFQYARSGSGGSTTVKAGSYVEWWQ